MTQLDHAQAQAGVYAIVLGNEANVAGESTDAELGIQKTVADAVVKL